MCTSGKVKTLYLLSNKAALVSVMSNADQLPYWLQCRSRQSAITTELIEIISGAAALEG